MSRGSTSTDRRSTGGLARTQRRQLGRARAGTKALADAEARLRRFQDAIAAGIDPDALVAAVNEAQAQRAELKGTPPPTALTDAEVYAMIDSLGDAGAAMNDAKAHSSNGSTRSFGPN